MAAFAGFTSIEKKRAPIILKSLMALAIILVVPDPW
jgi:hypothetical protein